jgi:lantibiotic modifying enzyme
MALGIAYALTRLFEITRDSRFRDGAMEGIGYESSVFSDEARNWPDLRSESSSTSTPVFLNRWCHGATGIGLARLGTFPVICTDEILKDINVEKKVYIYRPGRIAECLQNPASIQGDPTLPGFVLNLTEVWL